MKKGFTLLELIVVIIIIGILATLGLSQYMKVVEKGRTAEAKQNLGLLRSMMHIYYQENATYWASPANYSLSTGCAANTAFYFTYSVTAAQTEAAAIAIATRCTAAGKNPPASIGYTISMDMNGSIISSANAP